MKYAALLVIFGVLAATVQAQSPFLNSSYKTALDKARKEDKLICFLYLSDDCESCNEAMDKSLSTPKVKLQITCSFIPVRIGAESENREYLRRLFDLNMSSGVLFVDKNNNLVYKVPFNTVTSIDAFINEALKRQTSIAVLNAKEQSYFERNQKNVPDLEKLIEAKTSLEQDTRLLLTEYLGLLPKDSVNTVHTIQFLAKQSPVFESRAYNAMVRSALYSDAWYQMPVDERVKINDRIFEKSIKIAAATEDEAFAGRIAKYAAATYNNDGGKQYAERKVMMNYYLRTRNIVQYLDAAAPFYDEYLRFVINETKPEAPAASTDKELPEALRKINTVTAVLTTPPAIHARYLYEAANFFYKNDSAGKYLNNALSWAAKSVELAPNLVNQHVYALLLYTSGAKEKAIHYETLAIEESKKIKVAYSASWPQILQRMKNGEQIAP